MTTLEHDSLVAIAAGLTTAQQALSEVYGIADDHGHTSVQTPISDALDEVIIALQRCQMLTQEAA
jgi:hypothetical protein